MTILEAAHTVLKDAGAPLSIAEIYSAILEKDLYTFGAKSPQSVLSGTLRGHIRKQGTQIREVSKGKYQAL